MIGDPFSPPLIMHMVRAASLSAGSRPSVIGMYIYGCHELYWIVINLRAQLPQNKIVGHSINFLDILSNCLHLPALSSMTKVPRGTPNIPQIPWQLNIHAIVVDNNGPLDHHSNKCVCVCV